MDDLHYLQSNAFSRRYKEKIIFAYILLFDRDSSHRR